MSFDARLIHHNPGTMTSFEIPIQNGNFGEINYKSILNSLVAKSQKIEAVLSSSSSSHKQEPVFENKIWHNHYNNIIEKMERKYTSHMVVCDDENSDDHGYPVDEGTMEGVKTKKKKRSNDDYYDYDDPFVDDSEEVAEVYIQLKSKKSKTVHNGFFVSTGELELMKEQEIKKKEKMIDNENIRLLNKKENVNSNVSDFNKNVCQLNPTILKQDKDLKNEQVSQSSDTNDNMQNDFVSTKTSVRAVRTVKPKPLWQPDSDVLNAIDAFREFYIGSGIKIAKNGFFPPQLEASLCDLNKVVLAHHGNVISSTSGYIERIGEILGGEVTLGKIKNVISKLQYKEDAQIKNSEKEKIYDELTMKIKLNIKVYVPPKDNVTTLSAEKGGVEISGTDSTTDMKEIAAVPREMDTIKSSVGAGLIIDENNTDGKDINNNALTINPENESSGGTTKGKTFHKIPDNVPQDISGNIPRDGNIAVPIDMNIEGAVVKSRSCSDVDTSGDTFSTVEPCSCICQIRWDLSMKGLLIALEAAVNTWVVAENVFRGSLTALDKKDMSDLDFTAVNEKDSLTHTLKRLLGNYPPLCLHTDLSTIRKMLSVEKSRIKKKNIKEKETLLLNESIRQENQEKNDGIETQSSLQEKSDSSSALPSTDLLHSPSTAMKDVTIKGAKKISTPLSSKKNSPPVKAPSNTSNLQNNDSLEVVIPQKNVEKIVKKRVKKSKKEKAMFAVNLKFCKVSKLKSKKTKGNIQHIKGSTVEENIGVANITNDGLLMSKEVISLHKIDDKGEEKEAVKILNKGDAGKGAVKVVNGGQGACEKGSKNKNVKKGEKDLSVGKGECTKKVLKILVGQSDTGKGKGKGLGSGSKIQSIKKASKKFAAQAAEMKFATQNAELKAISSLSSSEIKPTVAAAAAAASPSSFVHTGVALTPVDILQTSLKATTPSSSVAHTLMDITPEITNFGNNSTLLDKPSIGSAGEVANDIILKTTSANSHISSTQAELNNTPIAIISSTNRSNSHVKNRTSNPPLTVTLIGNTKGGLNIKKDDASPVRALRFNRPPSFDQSDFIAT